MTASGRLREGSALICVALVCCLLCWSELKDGDLGFHLATGREVLASGHIPATNVLSFTNPQFPWELHQWLPGVLFELCSRWGGVFALQALRALLVIATWLLVQLSARALGASLGAELIACVLGASAAAFRFELRPYLFTHLALAAVVLMLTRELRAGAGAGAGARSERSRALWIASAITAVACHFHAGVVDEWIALGLFAGGCLVEPLRARLFAAAAQQPHGPRAAARALAAVALGIVLAVVSLAAYHPRGPRVLLFPFDMASDPYLAQHIVEFRAPTEFPAYALLAYWLLLACATAAVLARARSLHAVHLALVLGFAVLSLRHVRLAYDFAIVAAPSFALAITPLLARMRAPLRTTAIVALSAALLLQQKQLAPPGLGLAARTFPLRWFDRLDALHVQGPAFVSDAWAGPLLGRFYPSRKAFFDNRFEAYPRTFFRDVYQRARNGDPGWDRLLDRYGVEIALLRYTTPGEAALQGNRPNLRQRLAADPRWTLLDFDDDGELFVRSAGSNAALAARNGLHGLDPDRGVLLLPPRSQLNALRAVLTSGNRSLRLRAFAAIAALDAGDPEPARVLQLALPPDSDAYALYVRLRSQLGHAATAPAARE